MNSSVLSSRRKASSEAASLTREGREFQALVADTGNVQPPSVKRHVIVTYKVEVLADRR